MAYVNQTYSLVESFRPESHNLLNQSKKDINSNKEANLSYYLNSEQSQICSPTQEYRKNTANNQKFVNFQQKHYFSCPELYESFRKEHMVQEIKGNSFRIVKYNKGRTQMLFGDCAQMELNQVKLTVWSNGDYKLIYGDNVYFWCEEQQTLEKYSISL